MKYCLLWLIKASSAFLPKILSLYQPWQAKLSMKKSSMSISRSGSECLIHRYCFLIKEQARLIPVLQGSPGYPLSIIFTYPQEIPRDASGTFEDFISEVGRKGQR